MKQNIALCISGQMRTYRKCYGFLLENILNPLDPDVFIHTWRKQGGTTKNSGTSPVGDKIVTEQTLENLYSPVSVCIEDFNQDYFTQKDGVIVPDELKEATEHWKGNIPMFYKMYECNKMKLRHEEREEFTYDIVIKIRPDLLVREPIPEQVLNDPDTLWHSDCSIDIETQVSDKFAVSSSENMDYYTAVWENLNSYWERPLGDGQWENIRVGERLMRHHLEQKNISVKPFSNSCEILRTRQFAVEKNTTTISQIINFAWEKIQ